jgi:hypothetical protein
MAKEKVRTYKVHYKGLVKKVEKTLRALRKIEGRVTGDEQKDIELQIQHLDYLAGVCAKGRGKMTKAYRAKMTGCAMPKSK